MFKYINVLIASFVLGVVLAGLFNPVAQKPVFADTVWGVVIGFACGLVHVTSIVERKGTITRRRAKTVIAKAVRVDMVVGLLIGVGQVVVGVCGK